MESKFSSNMKFIHIVAEGTSKIISERNFIYFIIAITKLKKHIFNTFYKYVFFLKNCYNKLNGLSFTYNFDHVLIYSICKFHVPTTFN